MKRNLVPHILIVAEKETQMSSFSKKLEQKGFLSLQATSLLEVEHIFQDFEIFSTIISMDMTVEDSVDLIYEILDLNPAGSILAIASEASAERATMALEAGARDYFIEPIQDWRRFYHILRQSQQLWAEQLELQELRLQMIKMQRLRSDPRFDKIKGSSKAIQELLTSIQAISPLDVTTLIFGESGVGKELVARAIHNQSKRQNEAFVAVNCAAISAELFEAELFGYRKGAFTGANQDRPGFCSTAAKGTLFLDEIGELPLPLQPKLLRLLEQREYRPVGSDRIEKFTGRVIAATNVDLEEAVRSNDFREDLYFRLSVQELYVPPLRKRKGDIQLLSYYFLQRYNQVYEKDIHRIHPKALDLLEKYDWRRNNVRELEREIQRAMVRSEKGESVLLVKDLFWHHGRQVLPFERMMKNEDKYEQDEAWLDLPYAKAMANQKQKALRRYLEYHLRKADGNKGLAARNCGIQSANLSRLLREVEVDISVK